MENKIELFKSKDNSIELQVALDIDTVWLSQEQMVQLFGKERPVITKPSRTFL